MSEFGESRQNAGGNRLANFDRLNPTLDAFREIFPSAKVTLYTDQQLQDYAGLNVITVTPPFDRGAAQGGDQRTFLTAWHAGRAVGIITPELTAAVTALGEQFNLPAEFLGALAPGGD
jgi:hypothetical protein